MQYMQWQGAEGLGEKTQLLQNNDNKSVEIKGGTLERFLFRFLEFGIWVLGNASEVLIEVGVVVVAVEVEHGDDRGTSSMGVSEFNQYFLCPAVHFCSFLSPIPIHTK